MSSRIGTKHQLGNEPFQKELSRARKNLLHKEGLFVSKNTLSRTVLAMFLMSGYLSAYSAFGVTGLVVLALLVLLAISHPFWLMKWKHQQTKIPSHNKKKAAEKGFLNSY